MNTQLKALAGAALISSIALAGCNSSDDDAPAPQQTSLVSLGLSDAPVEDLSEVVVVIDYIELRRAGGAVTRIDTFTKDGIDDVDDGINEEADTFTINLLDYQGEANKLVFEDLELVVGEYQDLRLGVDPNESYVVETDGGAERPIKVPSNELKLGSFEITDQSTQTFVVEFDLRKAMTYNPGPDRYILKPRGVRIIGVEDAATLTGTITTPATMNTLGVCADKDDATVGNVAYLYAGHDLNPDNLGDMFVREDEAEDGVPAEEDTDVPVSMVAPFASAPIGTDGSYLFTELPAGNYTLALSCMAADDDPVHWDEIAIPSPDEDNALVEVTLLAGDDEEHDFTFVAEVAP